MKVEMITTVTMRDFATIAIVEKENEFFEKFTPVASAYDGDVNF